MKLTKYRLQKIFNKKNETRKKTKALNTPSSHFNTCQIFNTYRNINTCRNFNTGKTNKPFNIKNRTLKLVF